MLKCLENVNLSIVALKELGFSEQQYLGSG